MGAVEVVRPHAGLQAIRAVVGDGDGFGFRAETDDAHHRAEDLFAGDLHAVVDAIEHRGLDEAATAFQPRLGAAHQAPGALGLAGGDVAQHGAQLDLVDQRAHDGAGVQRVGRGMPRRLLGDDVDKLVGDAFVHQHTRRRVAAFALVEEHRAGHGLGRARDVRKVVEHHEGRLAAQFVVDTFQVRPAGVVQHAPARARGTGEADGVDTHVQGQRFAGFGAQAGHHVEHPRRQAGIDRQFGQPQRGERALLAGLEHHRIARRQRRPQLPRGHDHRIVPGHDDAHHAHRFARDECQGVGRRGGDLVVNLVHGFRVPGDAARRTGHVHGQRILDGLAHVQRFQQGKFVLGGQDLFGKLQQDLLAHRRWLASPAGIVKGRACGGHGRVDVRGPAARHGTEQAAVDG